MRIYRGYRWSLKKSEGDEGKIPLQSGFAFTNNSPPFELVFPSSSFTNFLVLPSLHSYLIRILFLKRQQLLKALVIPGA